MKKIILAVIFFNTSHKYAKPQQSESKKEKGWIYKIELRLSKANELLIAFWY
jgi:hypothetical protein